LKTEFPYKDDKVNGIVKSYYKSGELQDETTFKNDKRNGVGKIYYESGELAYEVLYKDGKAISGFFHSPNGIKRKMTNAHLHKYNQ
jgi:antitoxin component YwqK of YwqJK toxin-antitoxin module